MVTEEYLFSKGFRFISFCGENKRYRKIINSKEYYRLLFDYEYQIDLVQLNQPDSATITKIGKYKTAEELKEKINTL